MTIVFSCDFCRKQFELDAAYAGKKGRCSQCGHIFVIPRIRGGTAPSSGNMPAYRQAVDQSWESSRSGAQPRTGGSGARSETRPVTAARADHVVEDPYGLHDIPPPAKPTWDHDDLADGFPPDFPSPTSAGARRRKKQSAHGGADISFFRGIPGPIYLVIFGVLGAGAVLAYFAPQGLGSAFAVITVVIAACLMLYGWLGQLIIPFLESVPCGLMNMFVPFYGLYYLLTRWDAMKGVFVASLAGGGVIVATALLVPAIAAARMAADRAAGKVAVARQAPEPRAAARQPEMPEPLAANVPPPMAPRFGPPPGFPPRPNFPGLRGPRVMGMPPNFPVQAAFPQPGMDTIQVIVTGLPDEAARKAFGDRLIDQVRRSGGNFRVDSTSTGDTTSFRVWPVPDIRAFADQIEGATVTAVRGRTIEMRASVPHGDGT